MILRRAGVWRLTRKGKDTPKRKGGEWGGQPGFPCTHTPHNNCDFPMAKLQLVNLQLEPSPCLQKLCFCLVLLALARDRLFFPLKEGLVDKHRGGVRFALCGLESMHVALELVCVLTGGEGREGGGRRELIKKRKGVVIVIGVMRCWWCGSADVKCRLSTAS